MAKSAPPPRCKGTRAYRTRMVPVMTIRQVSDPDWQQMARRRRPFARLLARFRRHQP
jgi:hypothetical protein